jgi:hypothetical protein
VRLVVEQDEGIAHPAYGLGPTRPAFIEEQAQREKGREC